MHDIQMKRSNPSTVVSVRTRPVFIYQINGLDGTPVYIGQTVNKKRRASAHQSEASKCKLLRNFIQGVRSRSSTWKFADNFKTVGGCPDGVPSNRANAFECYFISEFDTVHNAKTNPDGCNMTIGNNAADMGSDTYDNIRAELEAGDIKVEIEYYATLNAMYVKKSCMEDLVEITRADDGSADPEIEHCYKLAATEFAVCSGEGSAEAELLKLELSRVRAHLQIKISNQVAEMQLLSNIMRSDMAKSLNSIITNVQKFTETNPALTVRNDAAFELCKKFRRVIANGEPSIECVCTNKQAEVWLRSILDMINHRDKDTDEAGMRASVFASRLAWCVVGAWGKGSQTADDAVTKCDSLLAEQSLTSKQHTRVLFRRSAIMDGSFFRRCASSS